MTRPHDWIAPNETRTADGTAGFLQSLARSIPSMMNIMRDVGGIKMPEHFGKVVGEPAATDGKPAPVTSEPATKPETAPGKRG